MDQSADPVVWPRRGLVAVGPDVVIFIVRVSGPAQVEPGMPVTGVIGNKIHDEIQTWWKQKKGIP